MEEKIKKFIVLEDYSIKEAMRIIDQNGRGTAIIVSKDEKFLGLITDGDIRRAILSGKNLETKVLEIANTNPIYLNKGDSLGDLKNKKQEIKKIDKAGTFLAIPVIDENKKVFDIFSVNTKDIAGSIGFLKEKLKPIQESSQKSVNKILVIGGAGYLGSVLCKKLLEKGYMVKVLDNLSYGGEGVRELLLNEKFEFQKGDIRNISDIICSIEDVDAVIHLAAIVGDPACAKDAKQTLEINYFATKNIIEACKYFQINRFIFASTCSVYGENSKAGEQLSEQSMLNPVSLYAKTKIECEKSILSAVDNNFSPVILRMATLYGYSDNMRFDLAVNLLTAKAIFDKEITIFGGSQFRPWLHLDDAVDSYILCLESPIEKIKGQIFNVLSENYKIIEVGEKIKSVCKEAVIKIEEKIIDKRNYNVSFKKFSRTLGFLPKKKIIDGVLEIKNAIEQGIVLDYKEPKYRASLPQN